MTAYSIVNSLVHKDLSLFRLAASQQRNQQLSLRSNIITHARRTPGTFATFHRAGQRRGIRIVPSSLPQNDPSTLPSEADKDAVMPPHTVSGQPRNTDSPVMYTINSFTQGHVTDDGNRNKRDPQFQSAVAGRGVRAHGDGSPLDAASAENGTVQMRPDDMGSGNKERIGFVEQVGSASATARMFEAMEREQVLERSKKLNSAMAGPKLGL